MYWLMLNTLGQVKSSALWLKTVNSKAFTCLNLVHQGNYPCPLCDEAKEVLEPYKHRFVLQEVDITLPENTVWYERYKYDIPVFHLNGQFLMMHKVQTHTLMKKLESIEEKERPNQL